jgi:hypothetical protein
MLRDPGTAVPHEEIEDRPDGRVVHPAPEHPALPRLTDQAGGEEMGKVV